MANLLECKICGGNIIPNSDGITGKCESCGETTAIPKKSTSNSKLNRANYLRRASEFDKAMDLFEEIVSENNDDSEAYWGLVLCKYGIEYVDDVDGSKKPTCHRTMFESILNDPDYKAAIDNAVGSVRYIYEEEAKRIDDIQRATRAIAANEKPYDIFICYKESDDLGQRTRDSVDAQEIYNRLTSKGYKVFFARKTLQNKLGSEYEPIIFAAISSAKIMLVYGSQPDYFNAVWVRNEWSRFRRMMKNDNQKKIIPIYDSSKMSAYDLPNELADFQAFDKYRVGFLQDLIEGIEKLMSENKDTNKKNYTVGNDYNSTSGLLERAYIFLGDGVFDRADEYFEKVLDINPKESRAYIGKLLIDFKLKSEAELEKSSILKIVENENYKKAVRFADGELKQRLDNFYYSQKYNLANELLSKAKTLDDYKSVSKKFKELNGFKDSNKRLEECNKKIAEINKKIEAENLAVYNEALRLMSEKKIEKAKIKFCSIISYRDSSEKVKECDKIAKQIAQEEAYQECLNVKNSAKTAYDFNRAYLSFTNLGDYKDSADLALECRRIEEHIVKKEAWTRNGIVIFFALAAVCVFVILYTGYPERKYDKAVSLMNQGMYDSAQSIFSELGDYEDSVELAAQCLVKATEQNNENKYVEALNLFKEYEYEKAKQLFIELGDYKDSPTQVQTCDNALNEYRYNRAISLAESGNFADAKNGFTALGDYKDSKTRLANVENQAKYENALNSLNNGDYDAAISAFKALGDYEDSRAQIETCYSRGYKKAYINYLDNKNMGDEYFYKYYLYDIDSNGIPELITSEECYGEASRGASCHIFTFYNNRFIEIYNNPNYAIDVFANRGEGVIYGALYQWWQENTPMLCDMYKFTLSEKDLNATMVESNVTMGLNFYDEGPYGKKPLDGSTFDDTSYVSNY